MRRNVSMLCVIVLLAGMTQFSGCVRRTASSVRAAARPSGPSMAFVGKTFAVAPFSIPVTDADLLSGYLPTFHDVPSRVLPRLDVLLARVLSASNLDYAPSAMSVGCTRTASRGTETGRLATMRYWQNVGLCTGADYLIVPFALAWHEREGSAVGVTSPASVNLSIYIVDVRTGGIARHYHFEETQKSLAENLADARKFVARHGRWLTAEELAQEGLTQGMRELGL